ncbi:hypothetical protein HGRIS_004624 [Hohenbuehelia grisea]|uniref:Brix domain-containing protein n=1 Tax=Hohenbuehelia grisea TaxID=104357 RepID=A0ABR3JD21_9AGAR
MPPTRFLPSQVKNKIKREELTHKSRKAKGQAKLQKRLARAKAEANDPAAKEKRLTENVPKTLDNMREYDPSMLTANPAASTSKQAASATNDSEQMQSSGRSGDKTNIHMPSELDADLASDPFASYFSEDDPMLPPKVLITTSSKASKRTYDLCNELVGVFPGAEFIRRKSGKGFELGRIAGWAGDRGYKHLCVVNEDMKKPNAITLIHLPHGPTAYFKLTSVQLTKEIFGHARATPHNPELILNNFVTRLGLGVGRMFQTLFPPMPEFQGRQVVTLHNQRDFLFFRRHRYAFRSTEKVALQEIGPRFTLKLRYLKKDIPAVTRFGEEPQNLDFDLDSTVTADAPNPQVPAQQDEPMVPSGAEADSLKNKKIPPKTDEFLWQWKVRSCRSRLHVVC